MDKLKLLMGRPILFDKEHGIYVHQPLVNEIVDMGEDVFNHFASPFTLTVESLFADSEQVDELMAKYHIFDLFFEKVDADKYLLDKMYKKDTLEHLKECFQYFLKVDNVKILPNRKKIIINDSFIIDKGTYQRLRGAIQAVTCRKDAEVERPPKTMKTERERDAWRKIKKGRDKKRERDAVYIQDIISYASLGGSTFIPYEKFDKMTYYQLTHTYKGVLGMDSFNVMMGYKLSQKYEVKDDVTHWTKELKIGK